ncbi:MAG: hypothetical protein U9Q90_00015 [Campylobacterota bacterium]|nr:hypothetical protein [Campylobacterota bacterium]
MRFIIFCLINISAYADIVTMDDGKCYERKGSMSYIVPCPQEETVKQKPKADKKENCIFKIGKYSIQYLESKSKNDNNVSCDDSLQYIKTMHLVYDKSLSTNKTKIGDLVVKKGLSECNIQLYYGDFLTIGLMSGDRLSCDDFMIYHSRAGK